MLRDDRTLYDLDDWQSLKEEKLPVVKTEYQAALDSMIYKRFVAQWIEGILQRKWARHQSDGESASKYLAEQPVKYDSKALAAQFKEIEEYLRP